MREKETDTYAGLWIQHKPQYQVIVQLTQGSTNTVQSYVKNTPLESLIQVRTVKQSLVELTNFLNQEVAQTIESSTLQANAELDVEENQIIVYVSENKVNAATTSAQFNSLLTHNQIKIVGIKTLPSPSADTTVSTVDTIVKPASDPVVQVIAGSNLAACTSGFNINYNGVRYAATAGHCTDTGYASAGIAFTQIYRNNTGPYDIALYKKPVNGFTLPNKYNATGTNTVTSQVGSVVGQTVCKVGKTTGFTCGLIKSVAFIWRPGDGAKWATADIYSCGGDSGAPIFSGQKAYGMLVGGTCVNGGTNNMVYMPILGLLS